MLKEAGFFKLHGEKEKKKSQFVLFFRRMIGSLLRRVLNHLFNFISGLFVVIFYWPLLSNWDNVFAFYDLNLYEWLVVGICFKKLVDIFISLPCLVWLAMDILIDLDVIGIPTILVSACLYQMGYGVGLKWHWFSSIWSSGFLSACPLVI